MQIIAHRGASARRPEHTPAAFELAVALGSDGIECDLRRCADGAVVCVHDATVDRTSDGSGRVADHDLDALRRLDWGAWRGPVHRGGRLVSLEELLERNRRWGVRLLLELKTDRDAGPLVEAVLAALAPAADPRTARVEGVMVLSFDRWALRLVRARAPELATMLLWDDDAADLRAGRLPEYADAAGPEHRLLLADPDLAERFRRNGHGVYTWTVDDPSVARRLATYGVTGVITDDPGGLRRALRSPRAAGAGARATPASRRPGAPARRRWTPPAA